MLITCCITLLSHNSLWIKKNRFGFDGLPFFVIALESFSYDFFTCHVVKNLKEGSSDFMGKVVKFDLLNKVRVSNVKKESGVISEEEISDVEGLVCSIWFADWLLFKDNDGL